MEDIKARPNLPSTKVLECVVGVLELVEDMQLVMEVRKSCTICWRYGGGCAVMLRWWRLC